jgi:hypothetical protein
MGFVGYKQVLVFVQYVFGKRNFWFMIESAPVIHPLPWQRCSVGQQWLGMVVQHITAGHAPGPFVAGDCGQALA